MKAKSKKVGASREIKTQEIKAKPVVSKPPSLPTINNATQFVNRSDLVRPRELVQGLVHQGTKAVLSGGSKTCKTWILLDLALSVATGRAFLRWPTTRGKVLFVNLEIHECFFKERLEQLMGSRGITHADRLHLLNLRGTNVNLNALVEQIIVQAEGKRYAMIIIDPVYKIMAGKSENSASAVSQVCNSLERIAKTTGAAVVFAHHFTKGNAKNKRMIDRMSGSGVFGREPDTIITLAEHSQPDCYTVEMVLRNLAPQDSFVVQWQHPAMVERDDLDPEDMRPERGGANEANDNAVLALLDAGPLASREWETRSIALGISRRTYFRVKSRLLSHHRVAYDRQTRTWSLVAPAPDPTPDTSAAGARSATDALRRVPRRARRVGHTSNTPPTPVPTPPAFNPEDRPINFDL